MKNYMVSITFDNSVIYNETVKANNKPEAYAKAKARLAKRLFKTSNLKNYDCQEI